MTCRNTILSAFTLAMGLGFAQAQDSVRTAVVDVEVYDYTYDQAERLVSVSVKRNGGDPTTLVRNSYDEFGRLRRQTLGDVAAVDYEYNVRGWITNIGCDYFRQTLNYEPCYNGDISAMEWTAKDVPAASANVTQTYRYGYDDLDRLQTADYSSVPTADAVLTMQNDRDYSCRYTYDLNGNVTSLRRKGVSDAVTANGKTYWTFGDIDNLSFTYNGNQLKKVVDQADDLTYAGAMDFKDGADKSTEYTYDANGNMTSDKNRKIHSITYNVLNLPDKVTFNDGHIIQYTYDADGRKLKTEYLLSGLHFLDWDVKNVSAAALGEVVERPSLIVKPVVQATVQYCANHVYRNGALERVDNGYGYWADSTYHYNIADYQGNIRAVVAADGTLEEVNNYYPYGALMAAGGVQPRKYGGKELERENGLDWYDSHARWYDSLTGRTPTLDPKADHYTSLSPYLWCAGNPMRHIDEGGDSIAVLHLKGAIGHLALLIQDNDGKWAYYSMNGAPTYNSTKGRTGGKSYPDLGKRQFDSPYEFINGDYNANGNKNEVQQDYVNNYGYDEAYIIPTTNEQDRKIEYRFREEAKCQYNVVNRQCAQVVQKALNAGGIKTTMMKRLYYDDVFLSEIVPYMPSGTFQIIRECNPKGKYIKKKRK